ncbi:MAG: hypothetical protein CM1200mP2_34670 [Planctomycetaceae bacterium]|nr:MAG: hypothetical protein CM1200mP2_34670 [Planctomycetaceae bacterium]
MTNRKRSPLRLARKMLFRQQKYLVDRLAVAEMFDELAGHEVPRVQRNGDRPRGQETILGLSQLERQATTRPDHRRVPPRVTLLEFHF